jgi:hypothetical protein
MVIGLLENIVNLRHEFLLSAKAYDGHSSSARGAS